MCFLRADCMYIGLALLLQYVSDSLCMPSHRCLLNFKVGLLWLIFLAF